MNYSIISYGSRGDVQPYIALSLELKKRGHVVTLLAPENFKEFVEGYGITFYPLRGNVQEILYSEEALHVLKTGNNFSLFRYLKKKGASLQKQVNEDILSGCKDANVLVTSFLQFMWVHSIAEKLGKKWALLQLSLPTVPTREYPFAGFSLLNFPIYNIITHKFIQHVHWLFFKKDINRFRLSIGLPALKKSIFTIMNDQRIPNLFAFSQCILTRPKDWPEHTDITGFLSVPFDEKISHPMDEIPAGLKDWLLAGEKPIYIGFGSMPVPNPSLFSTILNDLVVTQKKRVVFCTGWSVIPNLPASGNLFVVKTINHEWLFQRCAAAVVHGGIGTLAACLKSGTPLIVASIFGDQPWLGDIIQSKKMGTHIAFKKLTSKKILQAIADSSAPGRKKNLMDISAEMKKDEGTEKAAAILEKYFGGLSA